MNDSLLPLGILLLGLAGIAAFIALRPWPASPEGSPISAGAYAVEILQGKPPAASLSRKESGQQAATIAEIENGLFALILIWFVSKLVNGITGILAFFGVAELWTARCWRSTADAAYPWVPWRNTTAISSPSTNSSGSSSLRRSSSRRRRGGYGRQASRAALAN